MIIISPQLFFSSVLLFDDEYIFGSFLLSCFNKRQAAEPWLGVALHFCLVNLTQLQVPPSSFLCVRFFFLLLPMDGDCIWNLFFLPSSLFLYIWSVGHNYEAKEMLLQFTPLLLDMLFECLNCEIFYGCRARNLARLTLPQNCQFMCNFLIEKHTFCVLSAYTNFHAFHLYISSNIFFVYYHFILDI